MDPLNRDGSTNQQNDTDEINPDGIFSSPPRCIHGGILKIIDDPEEENIEKRSTGTSYCCKSRVLFPKPDYAISIYDLGGPNDISESFDHLLPIQSDYNPEMLYFVNTFDNCFVSENNLKIKNKNQNLSKKKNKKKNKKKIIKKNLFNSFFFSPKSSHDVWEMDIDNINLHEVVDDVPPCLVDHSQPFHIPNNTFLNNLKFCKKKKLHLLQDLLSNSDRTFCHGSRVPSNEPRVAPNRSRVTLNRPREALNVSRATLLPNPTSVGEMSNLNDNLSILPINNTDENIVSNFRSFTYDPISKDKAKTNLLKKKKKLTLKKNESIRNFEQNNNINIISCVTSKHTPISPHTPA